MFQKPAFGANTSGFGAGSTFGGASTSTTSPFSSFKPAAAGGAFGAAPAFGAPAAAQPAQQTGLFGGASTSGGLFGAAAPAAAAPAFGAASGGFGFGAGSAAGGLFNSSATGMFQPQQTATTFGAKPAGFGFGGTTSQNTSGGLFGNTQQAGTSLFGQQNNTMNSGGLFGNTTGGFGAAAPTGTAHVKYAPLVGTDVVVKSGASQNINIKHHCITCMKEYESKSLEELRLEDYTAGRKGSASGMFGFNQPAENKPLFGAQTSTFGAPATSAAPSVFGGGALGTAGGFGQPNSSFSFGGASQANTNTSGLFGAQTFGQTSTAGASVFGAAPATQASTFGTNTSTFGFGSNLQNQTTGGGLFGAKPATSGFGAPAASTSFGAFSGASGGLFGAKPLQTQAPAFGAPQAGVGSMAGGFGTSTSTSGLFGGGFGKPATTQPSFGFGAPQPTLGVNTGVGSTFGQSKPATQGFGALGGSLFQQPQQNNTFRTGLDSGLGGGLFGNTMGSLGLGANNNSSVANLSGASAAGNVHEQILALAARPYGDSPLFKDLLPDSTNTADEALKPTNPAAQAAVLARAAPAYRVAAPGDVRLPLRPRAQIDKKSLFDGLEQSDASLDDKLSLKPSRKRLVLRPQQRNDNELPSLRSPEENVSERPTTTTDSLQDKENANQNNHSEEVDRVKRNIDFPDNNSGNAESSSERQASWLGSAKLSTSWSRQEPPGDADTPRLYPNLEKDLRTEVSERRASWLTTKTLRPPPALSESAENSVRELGLRSELASPACERDLLSVSEEEPPAPRPAAPHPAGVRCTRPGYYTIPSLEEMTSYLRADGTCKVPHLTIGRTNYGNVHFDSEIDVAGLDIDSLVHFLNKEVIVYPTDADKPPVGVGLNRRAIVTLDRIWPRDKTQHRPIDDPQRLLKMDYEGKLRRVCDKHDTKFVEYRPRTGSWVFRVEHFSKYGLTDSDEEDDVPDVIKRQLVQQGLQAQAPAHPPPPVSKPLPPVGGLGGLGGLGLSGGGLISSEDSIFAMQQTSINLLSGASKAFEMDTSEENAEAHSLYQDSRALSVKSPTSELAKLENRQSAHLQLMKASLYADTELEEDDVSVSTGDQLVPRAPPAPRASAPAPAPALLRRGEELETEEPAPDQEVSMKPLQVQPHSIVLRYHRKIPPFKNTIAGRLGASCLADLSVSRARHSRVGFGPGGVIVYPTTYQAVNDLPINAELSDLCKYVCGRGDEDWSEGVLARLALAQPGTSYDLTEVLSRHLESLFSYSEFVEPVAAASCPRLRLAAAPRDRYAALQQIIRDADDARHLKQKFGVSGAYCLEVWKLCDALWGADLLNDGVPGTSDAALVERHRRLQAWLTACVSDVTDQQLAQPTPGEEEDPADGHSARIWTLLLGGRVVEACRAARAARDLNMAALLAQASGDLTFRSLILRQLSLWRECGASGLVSASRRGALSALGGARAPPLRDAHWTQALLYTHSYLCPPVPSLEQVVRRYESLFAQTEDEDEEVDLCALPPDEMGMRYPSPHYMRDDAESVGSRRVLDLRYELIRARAMNSVCTVRPEQYTPDPMDYTLSFLLGIWFGAPGADSALGAARQLEAAGRWHAAAHALCYLPDDNLRAHMIRGVLSRHAPARADSAELKARLASLERLRIPREWVLLAQAHRAKYEHLPQLEAEYLVGAGRWNEAHQVLIQQLLPDAVLADDLESISPLLEQLSCAAGRSEVSGWEAGGAALHQYMHVCHEIRSLVGDESSGADVSRRLEALRPLLAAACRALAHLPPSCPRTACARAEMGARLAQVCRAGGAGGAARAALLRRLNLPPDTAYHAHAEITSELAEQAAELCIESASDSPPPHRHAARTLLI